MAEMECRNIYKTFGSVTALKDVSLRVSSGEVRALFGGNGSGKSTLAKIMGGFVRPDGGELFLDGSPAKFASPAQARKNRVIISAQELSLFPNLSVAQNLALCNIPTKAGRVNGKELRHMAESALKRIHMPELIDKRIEDLPLDQKYMVEFAKALVQKPSILILDEITSALYREEVAIVGEVVKELKNEECGIIFVSHRMPEIYAMCDTITVLRNGGPVGTFRIADKSKNELLSLMTGRDIADVEMEKAVRNTENRKVRMRVENLSLLSKGSRLDLSVYEGEIVGVAGLQGNGQSDLVRALFAVDAPIGMELAGRRIKIRNPQDAVKEGIAFISGERELEGTFANRSIMENVGAVTDLVLKRKSRREEKRGLLEKYHVVMNSLRQQIQTLSGGNQQKVVMARWTAIHPKLILADDPTKGIDVNARRDVHNLFKELVAGGTSVIFVSSDDEELVDLTRTVPFSRVIVMYDGGIVETLCGEDITTENIAACAMPKTNEVEP